MIELLQKNWSAVFRKIVGDATTELFISSPYITGDGSRFISDNMSTIFRRGGKATVLTNLSPMSMAQGATDPAAIGNLWQSCSNFELWHLPSLHAKLYISDKKTAIITSANLTMGGLVNNFEYGVSLSDPKIVTDILDDALTYCRLGYNITRDQLESFCLVAKDLKETYKRQISEANRDIQNKFSELSKKVEDELAKERLSSDSINNVFSKIILYLIGKLGQITTEQMEEGIKQIRPDLCDDSIDRVINGRHFGKKWKHWVRSSQQYLKRKRLITLSNGKWLLSSMKK